MVMDTSPARNGPAEVDPSQRAPPRPPAKRTIDQIVTLDTDTDDEHESQRAQSKKGKSKGKAVGKKTNARAPLLELSSDEGENVELLPLAAASTSSSTHQPDPTSSPTHSASRQDAIATVLAIIPDIKLAYLDKLVDQQLARPGSVARDRKGYDVGRIVDDILTKGTYPKEGQAEKDLVAQAERDAKVDWLDLRWRGDGKRMSDQYKDQA